ncbi:Inosose dehydratase [compost metagenome]
MEKAAAACRIIADHAAQYGITTSVENHGYYVQASDRVQALIHAVDRPNFKTTLDVGNFVCVDENPVTAVKSNLPYASMVHIKDFYIRPSYRNPGEGWFRSAGGNYLRGAIAGQGDLDLWEILRTIKSSGYDGFLSIEYEGMEDCLTGTKIAFDNVRRIWDEV